MGLCGPSFVLLLDGGVDYATPSLMQEELQGDILQAPEEGPRDEDRRRVESGSFSLHFHA